MGIPFPCPIANYVDLENSLESLSVNFEEDRINTLLRFISSNNGDSELRTMKSEGNVNMELEEIAETLSNPEYNAAVKLQKVYKSFRTRRKLADCAVLVEQRWWKLLDFAELNSISFFDGEKQETAVSRWARAGARAAKVGKGLSKNNKGQKLALQHWLEAIDPRHRYGHNLHFYYKEWLNTQSREPFFYWLDIGEGKEKDLAKCSRSKLQQQCIKYLGPMERKAYEISLENGKFFYKQSGQPLHTMDEPNLKWIFVLSTSKIIYAGKKKKGSFQHSSFLAGGAALAAGRLEVENGTLKAVWPHSGHYRPTEESFKDFLSFLEENNVDLTNVKLSPADEDETSLRRQGTISLRSSSSEGDLANKLVEAAEEDKTDLAKESSIAADSSRIRKFARNLSNLEIPKRSESFEEFNADPESPLGCYKADEELEPEKEPNKTLQIGKQLSCKWTTGAGPRIGFVRDCPTELQVRALEHVNLSPRKQVGLSRSLTEKNQFLIEFRPNSLLRRENSASPGILEKTCRLT